MRKTVFVVGAGASAEFDFPLGSGLVTEIRELVTAELQSGTVGTLRTAAANGGYINEFDEAAREMAGGLIPSRSIDRFLHSRRDREAVKRIGKNAISLIISQHEAKSSLRVHEGSWLLANNAMLKWRDTWIFRLFALLYEGKMPQDAANMFDDVSFITFNYDRVIEEYLRLALMHTLGRSLAQASEIVGRLPIHHVYGSLGDISVHPSAGGFPFGPSMTEVSASLQDISSKIRTFTESEDADVIGRCRQEISSAELIVFLGFGFDVLNLEALFPEPLTSNQFFSGTSLGIGPQDSSNISKYLASNGASNLLIQSHGRDYIGGHAFRDHIGL